MCEILADHENQGHSKTEATPTRAVSERLILLRQPLTFNPTICVLEALLAYERAVERGQEITEARLSGQEYLLERRLFRRRSTREVIERDRKGRLRVDALRVPDVVALRRA